MVPVHGRRVRGVCRVNKRRDHMKIKVLVWEQVVYLKGVLFWDWPLKRAVHRAAMFQSS